MQLLNNASPLIGKRDTWNYTILYDNPWGQNWTTATVVPEPISSILFAAGGILLGGRHYIERKKHKTGWA